MKKMLKFWIFMAVVFTLIAFNFVKEGFCALAVFYVLLFAFVSVLLFSTARKHYADEGAVSVELLDESEIVTKQSEKVGSSIHYGQRISVSEHYAYKDVVSGYRCTFLVKYENGKERKIRCKKGDKAYQKLSKLL